MKRASLLILCVLLNWQLVKHVSAESLPDQQSPAFFKVYVDDFAPYINAEGQQLGSAAKLLRTLGEYSQFQVQYTYVPYSDAMALLRLNKEAISFPYFRTKERAQEFLYSKPVVQIRNHIYYSRQFHDLKEITDLQGLKVGTVVGYSYGESIDQLIENPLEFESDLIAVAALLRREIDVLPMAAGVLNAIVLRYFKDQRELIRNVDGIQSEEFLHVIAPKSAYGERAIKTINDAIELKFAKQKPAVLATRTAPRVDVAELIPAEGFPAIIGQSADSNEVFTLPIGTQVVVLDWSDDIRKPNEATSINRNMLLTSKVVVLNGPHVGKELMIRNMHLQLVAP